MLCLHLRHNAAVPTCRKSDVRIFMLLVGDFKILDLFVDITSVVVDKIFSGWWADVGRIKITPNFARHYGDRNLFDAWPV